MKTIKIILNTMILCAASSLMAVDNQMANEKIAKKETKKSWFGKTEKKVKKTKTVKNDKEETNDYWNKKALQLVNAEKKRMGKDAPTGSVFAQDAQILQDIITKLQNARKRMVAIGQDVDLAQWGEDYD